MPLISVIVPVYKVEPYLRRCVDSILNQTFQDFELILVDDGSPDNCGAICDEYAVVDSRVHVIHQENRGLAAARNRGIDQSRAEWICFVDSDDLIHPQMLEHMYGIVVNTGVKLAACSAIEAETVPNSFWGDKVDEVVCRRTDEEGLIEIQDHWKYCYWVVWGKLIQKDIIQKLPMTEGRVYEDNAVVFRWLHEARTVSYTSTPYYFYQVNPKGITKSAFSLRQLDWLWALKEQVCFYRQIGYKTLDKETTARFLIQSVWNIDKCVSFLNNHDAANQIRRDMKHILRGRLLSSLPLTQYQKQCVWEKLNPRAAQLRRKWVKFVKRIVRKIKQIISTQ